MNQPVAIALHRPRPAGSTGDYLNGWLAGLCGAYLPPDASEWWLCGHENGARSMKMSLTIPK